MNLKFHYNWDHPQSVKLPSKAYVCGYCGNPLASDTGYRSHVIGNTNLFGDIYICHYCTRPTFFDISDTDKEQTPGHPFGNDVKEISDESVLKLYKEARRATSANCYTAAVLCCRKLLMHIAVSKNALKGRPFIYYVNYLSKNNYVPPDAKEWVDHIRKKSNEANHEINIMESDDAKELIEFCEMLLKLIYEFPSIVKKKYGDKNNNETEEIEDKELEK